MKRLLSVLLCLTLLGSLSSVALAAKSKATETPPPVEITSELVDPPEQIQHLLDIVYNEWVETAGKALPDKGNKYQTWWNSYKWEWCAGFVTWCMLEAGIPQATRDEVFDMPEEAPEAIYHVKASSPGKMLGGYEHFHRTTRMPQKGFIILYGVKSNGYNHVGFVYDVKELGDGKYRLTSIEGNMSDTVKMYVFDYDMNAEKKKCITAVPEEERTEDDSARNFTYKIRKNGSDKWYINYFLMPWVPGEAAD